MFINPRAPMIAKNNRVNSRFQIMHFLAGSCHTADGAYALLCDLRDDRADALAQVRASQLRDQAKRLRAERALESDDEPTRLDALADLAEIEGWESTSRKNVEAAQTELAEIEELMERLRPHRAFAHLPDPEAHAAAQRDEWRLELCHRAENYLMATGTIPADQLGTMRQHPDFEAAIYPHILEVREAMAAGLPYTQGPGIAGLLEAL